ncbi:MULTISPECIES: Lrp/AsnC family transcriptional regulator [unclassified Cupriavidus]|jgi:Lrp/AsnC family transcriptional regulator|uniref:Lrp/AsnC family transcriptional regulator n=1 Tax=unclassified Cupriavidus TaxID=2640874 RepID=UPI001C005292|nr:MULTISPECIES: Lrp/AsnC family transcriptional regulator [unclassified Cupriavidus]MCA3188020.1 Lrp/AsnC family transcriptional regulator [Cupriavidus sp.]MCA3190310.1 Lrp/AsnC family transcriptional regulator [Cupriavidus sp.]MCA3197014.1 Lrp/AsnC family transcriptional regulator [Cupriavidus sp.]MCA3202291.1 Lrp/AsnC family transcriptional regulator [Cupriavidus sp.]MCA3205789.1 Lrp/AsnC family transcriptional regulator [Cupriavidus sp.]
MDRYDRQILGILQEDASVPVADIGERVGLTSTPCWRRVQKLEESGVIRKRVALLDAAKLNVGVTVFVSIRTSQHNVKWLKTFHDLVASIPEVTEFYRMAGNTDYLLRVVVPDIAAYDAVYKKLIHGAELADVSSSFAMEQIKYTTALPLDYA